MNQLESYLLKIQDDRVAEGIGQVAYVVTGAIILKKALKTARSIYRKIKNNATLRKYCKDKKGYEKEVCKSKIKAKAWAAYKKEVKKWMAQCSEAYDAQKCRKKFEVALNKVDDMIMKERERMSRLAQKYQ
jgi:guanylate kinase